MAFLRCMPSANAFAGVTPTGSGSRAVDGHEWEVGDAASTSGNVLYIDIDKLRRERDSYTDIPVAETGYQLEYFEIAIEERGGTTKTERVLFGPATIKRRFHYTNTSATEQRVRIRQCMKAMTEFWFDDAYTPSVDDAVSQSSTGATADVAAIFGNYVILKNISGTFATDTSTPPNITINGNTGLQRTPLKVPALPENQVEIKSEWSAPIIVSPSAGTPTVNLTLSKSTCIQGEGIIVEVDPVGFDCSLPTQELHFYFTVAKAGEQGSYTALGSPCYFEDMFGSARNDRCEGFSRVWGFYPKTTSATGTITISCTVRDRSGNSVTDTADLTVHSPTDEANSGFADADIYACSATSRAVPGTTSPNIYTDINTLAAALPSTGEALILLDTTGTHGATAYEQLNLTGLAPDRLCIMQYNSTGVGPAAGERANIDFCFRYDSDIALLSGVNCIGPYDPTDPNSVAARPPQGWQCEVTARPDHVSVTDCKIAGWDKSLVPPDAGEAGDGRNSKFAVVDVEMTEWVDFGMHGGNTTTFALAGVYAYMNPESWHYEDNKFDAAPPDGEGFFVDHPGLRTSRPAGNRGLSKVVFFSCASWGGPLGSQPAARWFGGAQQPPYSMHITEFIFEAAAVMTFGCTANGGDRNFDAPCDICLDKGFYFAAQGQSKVFEVSIAPITFRNIHCVSPDSPGRADSNTGYQVFTISRGGATSNWPQWDTINQPIVLENITFVALQSDATADTADPVNTDLYTIGSSTPFSDVTSTNHLVYIPNLTSAAAANSTDLETGSGLNTTPQATPLYKGDYFWDDTLGSGPGDRLTENLAQSIDMTKATPTTVTASYEPQTGSGAIGAGSGSQPYDDILSRVRSTGTKTIGAYDPNGTSL